MLDGFAGVRLVPETIKILHGIVIVAKHWLSNTGCSVSGENWWHGSGQDFWHNSAIDKTNGKVACCGDQ